VPLGRSLDPLESCANWPACVCKRVLEGLDSIAVFGLSVVPAYLPFGQVAGVPRRRRYLGTGVVPPLVALPVRQGIRVMASVVRLTAFEFASISRVALLPRSVSTSYRPLTTFSCVCLANSWIQACASTPDGQLW
jgi:hypothetical protein